MAKITNEEEKHWIYVVAALVTICLALSIYLNGHEENLIDTFYSQETVLQLCEQHVKYDPYDMYGAGNSAGGCGSLLATEDPTQTELNDYYTKQLKHDMLLYSRGIGIVQKVFHATFFIGVLLLITQLAIYRKGHHRTVRHLYRAYAVFFALMMGCYTAFTINPMLYHELAKAVAREPNHITIAAVMVVAFFVVALVSQNLKEL